MTRIALAALVLALSSPVFSQQLSPEQAAAAQLGQQIGLLTHDNGALRSQLQQLNGQLVAAMAKVKDLENKYEPKKPPETEKGADRP